MAPQTPNPAVPEASAAPTPTTSSSTPSNASASPSASPSPSTSAPFPEFPKLLQNDPKRTGYDPQKHNLVNYFRVLTGKMTDAGSGRWAIDDISVPSPSVFHYRLPPAKTPGAPQGEITSTLTVSSQQQRILLDPTFATASTSTSTIKDMSITTAGTNLTQLTHIDGGTGTATVTLRVPLLRLTSLCLPGVQSLKVPTAETGPVCASSGRTNWILVVLPLEVIFKAMSVTPCAFSVSTFRGAPGGTHR